VVKTFGDQFLAGAPLANDEHRPIERRGAARSLDGVEERKALTNELLASLHRFPAKNPTDCWWQIPPFGKDFQVILEIESNEIAELGYFMRSGTPLV
jgi:hypothetical protein